MLLAVAMCAGLICAPASAATAEESLTPDLVETQDIGIVPFAATVPSYNTLYALGTIPYEAMLDDLAAQRGTYTKTCFTTPTGQINLTFNLVHSGTTKSYTRSMTVTLYEYYVWFDDGWNEHYSYREVDSKSLSYNSFGSVNRSMAFSGLSNTKHYFILFYNTSYSNPNEQYDIAGKVFIKK